MNDNELKKFAIKLAKAESEIEVINILKSKNLWESKSNWRDLGDNENNFSTIGNQQSSPENALVEKVINSIDAMLLKECRKRGIDPESSNTPKSMYEAVEHFFDVKRGSLANMVLSERKKLAENICLIATGEKSSPNYILIDKGEGQNPINFSKTFLSLNKSNKLKVAFVQGKFNMGGTGILKFCGNQNLNLIISRRNIDLADSDNKWGITIIRRENPSGNMKSSKYTYLVNDDNDIFSFFAENLPLLPSKYPNPYDELFYSGTFMKMYEYKTSPGLSSPLILDMNNRLSLLLPRMALPVRLFERRDGYKANSYESILFGNYIRLLEDKRNNLEENFPSNSRIVVDGQEMNYLIYALKKGSEVNYKKSEGIIFTVNGQTQGGISQAFFKRKSVGMSYLAKSLLIELDCSKLNKRISEDLFLNSRDRLSDITFKKKIENALAQDISKHPGLRELRAKRRQEEFEDKISESKPVADVINKIISKSPVLAKLLIKGEVIQNPFNLTKTGSIKKDFTGGFFPSYFKLISKSEKHCPINQDCRVQFETDVENTYFNREDTPGFLEVSIFDNKIENYKYNLWNGVLTLTIQLPENVEIEDKIRFRTKCYDEFNPDGFVNTFTVVVEKEKEKNNGVKGERKNPKSNVDGDNREEPEMLAIPPIQEVRTDDYSKYENVDKYSALWIKDAGDGHYDFYINMDNIYLQSEIKSKSNESPQIFQSKFKYALVLIAISMINQYNYENDNIREDRDIEEEVANTTKAIGPVLLPMLSALSEIDFEEE